MTTFPVVEHKTSEKWNCATQHAADINNRTQIVSPTSNSMVSSFRTHRMPAFRPTGDPASAALTWIAGEHDQLTWRKWWSSPSWLRWMTAGWPNTWGAFLLVSGRGSSGVRVGGGRVCVCVWWWGWEDMGLWLKTNQELFLLSSHWVK